MDLVLKVVVTFVVLAGFTYLRVERLVKRRRALGCPELPGHMPLLAGVVGALLMIPIVWIFPSVRQDPVFFVTVPLSVGIGVGAGVRRGMRGAGDRAPDRASRSP